jgi:hypothetical protein
MGKNNPYSITTQEVSTIFYLIGFLIMIIMIMDQGMPFLYKFLMFIAMLFFGISMFTPNNNISKYNLNMFMDKQTNPDFENWLRVTKNRMFAPQTVKKGVLGQSKGIVHGCKADIINRGDFTITLPNGNHALIKYDTLSHNINLNHTLGWKLIKRRFSLLGSAAFQRCYEDGKTTKRKKIRYRKGGNTQDDKN